MTKKLLLLIVLMINFKSYSYPKSLLLEDSTFSIDDCRVIELSDKETGRIFEILNEFEYSIVLDKFKNSLEITKELVPNVFDTLAVDTLITLKIKQSSFTYYAYSSRDSKSLVQVEIINDSTIPFDNNHVGDPYEIIWKKFIKKYLPKTKISKERCVIITSRSGYTEFYLFFKNDQLYSFMYYDNTGMY